MRLRHPLIALGFVLAAVLGYWLAGTAAPKRTARKQPDMPGLSRRVKPVADDPAPQFRRAERPPAAPRDTDAERLGALTGQRVLVFKDREALERFLKNAGAGIRILGRLDAFNALRIGFSNAVDLAGLLDGSEEISFVVPVNTPPLPDGGVQPGAVALGNRLLEWLGISGDNSTWGAGVRIAVLDTGVASHSAFQSAIRSINLVDFPADPAALNGHGTAVASLIIGSGSLTPGVAPGAEIISVRVANDLGQSNNFLLAQGIIAAVDAGARLINISMEGFGGDGLLGEALTYAAERGALVFAAAGNKGLDDVYFPAATKGAIIVGAVDAGGNRMDFSNSGGQIAISAPGYGVNAAWPGDQVAAATGTSFSTPIVVGSVAAVMTEAGTGNLTPAQAWQLLLAHLSDGGAAGKDPQLGAGMPDISQVLNAGTPGIHDAAVASQRILPPDAANPYGQVEILIQNRGTENLVNTAVKIATDGTSFLRNITTLAPNAVTTVRVPVPRPPSSAAARFTVDSRVSLSGGFVDVKPANDRRIETYAPAGSP
jgi:hypothetical protein